MRSRQILDAIHGYIDVPPRLGQVLEAPAVQRLRRISQTALASMVYPSANGTRFEHALGAMQLARSAFTYAWDGSERTDIDALRHHIYEEFPRVLPQSAIEARDVLATAVATVGLLHDVGHPPFSHALEDYFRLNAEFIFADSPTFIERLKQNQARPFHEVAGQAILDYMGELFPSTEYFELIRTIYSADPDEVGWASALHAIVASTIDIDRVDYIMRDSYHAGTEYGAIDVSRLIGAMEFRQTTEGDIKLVLGLRARSAAELLLVQRLQAFRWMYQHPKVVAVEALLRRALDELRAIQNLTSTSGMNGWTAKAVRALTPPLNYVRPSSSYRLSGLSIRDVAPPSVTQRTAAERQLELPLTIDVPDETTHTDPSRSVFSEVQLSVTDDAIVRFCSSAAIGCRAAINRGADAAEIQRFLHYYDASLRRSSALVVLWKRYEEYASIAEQIYGDAAVQQYLNRLKAESDRMVSRLRGHLEGHAKDDFLNRINELVSDPLLFFNYLGYRLLHREGRHLSDMLSSEYRNVAGYKGIWECSHSARKDPLHSVTSNVSLEGKRGASTSLERTSPLVASLNEVERRSINFHAFYIITDAPRSASLTRFELRQRLREAFVRVMPVFLRQHLDVEIVSAKGSMLALADIQVALGQRREAS